MCTAVKHGRYELEFTCTELDTRMSNVLTGRAAMQCKGYAVTLLGC